MGRISNRELLNEYIEYIENVYINNKSVVSLLYSLINTNEKGFVTTNNIAAWNSLQNISERNLSKKENLNLIDKKNVIKEFISSQFDIIRDWDDEWNYNAKSNFINLAIDWLGLLIDSDENKEKLNLEDGYHKIKLLEENVEKANDTNMVIEYTNAFIREFDISIIDDDENESFYFEYLIGNQLMILMEDISKFESDSASFVGYSLKNSFGFIKDDLKDKNVGILGKVTMGLSALNPAYHATIMIESVGIKKSEINALAEGSKSRLFLACCYIIFKVVALIYDINDESIGYFYDESVSDDGSFNFDNI